MDFQSCLRKYGCTNFEVKLINFHDRIRINRGVEGRGTHIIFHTEGVATKIPGKADRGDAYAAYVNGLPWGSVVCPHGYIAFSGKLTILLALENGSNAAGNELDNNTASQFETQDNGYYESPSTYTEAQYKTWTQVYCAVKEFYKSKYGTTLKFENSREGAMDHRQIDTGRACPGAFDGSRVLRDAAVLWDQVNNDKLYRVFDKAVQIGSFELYDNAFNLWYDSYSKRPTVTYKGKDVTQEFKDFMTKLEKSISDLKAEQVREINSIKSAHELTIQELKAAHAVEIQALAPLAKEASEFKKSFFYFIYKLFNRDEQPAK